MRILLYKPDFYMIKAKMHLNLIPVDLCSDPLYSTRSTSYKAAHAQDDEPEHIDERNL